MYPFSPYSLVTLFCLCAFSNAISQTGTGSGQGIVSVQSGKVQGQVRNGVFVFKSIPYAAPPVGALKFAIPHKPVPWKGTRSALEPGSTAPFKMPADNDIDAKPVFGKGWVKGDDYLAVNIWTPALEEKRMPVMVFIHGGAFVLGTSDVPLYDGTAFAKKGVVLVSLNYRLGIEGFLKIGGVPTNLGIRDQIAALQWVHDNIAAFGGDPANVTIMGESAGAMSVGVLLASPPAQPLFKRAIMLSGSGQAVFNSEQAERIAKQYAKVLRIQNTRDAYLRFSPEQLLAAQASVTPKMVKLETEEHADPSGGLVLFFPVIDGDIVPGVPLKQLQKKTGVVHDLLIGYNSDEANYFLVPTGLLKKIRFNMILNAAVKRFYPAPAALTAVYKKAYPEKNLGQLLSAILTAYQFQLPSIRFADAHAETGGKTFMYEFAWKSSVAQGAYGAYHGIGLPFVFNNLNSVQGERGMLGPEGGPAELAEKMQAAFVQFARTGEAGWDAYNKAGHKTMLIDKNWQLQTDPHKNEVSIWSGVR